MTFTRKIFTYLGFCPGKESAEHFRLKNNSFTQNARKWKPRGIVTSIGVLLIFAGLMPFYLEDSSVIGVTDSMILHGRLGLTSFILGAILIIFGAIIPKIITILGIEGV
jgi:hypothetical protein